MFNIFRCCCSCLMPVLKLCFEKDFVSILHFSFFSYVSSKSFFWILAHRHTDTHVEGIYSDYFLTWWYWTFILFQLPLYLQKEAIKERFFDSCRWSKPSHRSHIKYISYSHSLLLLWIYMYISDAWWWYQSKNCS